MSSNTFLLQQGDARVWLRFANDFLAILQVSRGMGPRALEQWLYGNACQVWPKNKNAPEEAEEATNYKAHIVSPYYRAYLQSLVLVVKDKQFLDQTYDIDFTLTLHAVIQGIPQPADLATLAEEKDCVVQILRSVPSNTAGLVSLVQLTHTQSPISQGKFFRSVMEAAGFPILGKAEGSRSFRGQKLLMSMVRLQVTWKTRALNNNPTSNNKNDPWENVVMENESPLLFQTLLDKEERFWRERNPGGALLPTHQEVALPRAYQEGCTEFAGLHFVVSPAVMIPRPGSLAVIECAKALWDSVKEDAEPTQPVILDLGTGSGCLLLALLHWFPQAIGYGVDASAQALEVAQTNAQTLLGDGRCEFLHATFADVTTPQPANLVVCNPPYHLPGRQLEAAVLQYEPQQALFVEQGCTGLSPYVQAWSAVTRNAAPGAIVAMEVCRQNAKSVYEYLAQEGLQQISMARDAKGCIRSVQGRLAF